MKQKDVVKTKEYLQELRRIIDLAGGTHSALAKRLNIKTSAVGNWISTKTLHFPSIENVYAMQQLFNANPKILRGNNRKKIIVIEC